MGVWGKRDGTIVHEEEPSHAEPARADLAESPLTPAGVFYSRNHGPIPDVTQRAGGSSWTAGSTTR